MSVLGEDLVKGLENTTCSSGPISIHDPCINKEIPKKGKITRKGINLFNLTECSDM